MFHQISFLKGLSEGAQDAYLAVRRLELKPKVKEAVQDAVAAVMQRNHRRYAERVQADQDERARAGLSDEPSAAEVAAAAWRLVQLVRQGCGDMHPDFANAIRVVENGYGVQGSTELRYRRMYSPATQQMEMVPVLDKE
jgi:hypothetical protein